MKFCDKITRIKLKFNILVELSPNLTTSLISKDSSQINSVNYIKVSGIKILRMPKYKNFLIVSCDEIWLQRVNPNL